MPKIDDLRREARLESLAGATRVTRTFRVSGIVDNPYDILFAAINFPGVPQVGDQYPGVNNDDYRVRSVRAYPDGQSGQDVIVVCTYSDKTGETWNQARPQDPGDAQDVKQFSTGLGQYTTTRDASQTPAAMVLNPPSGVSLPSYLSRATVQKPVGNVVFERTETLPPAQRTRNMVGTVNSLQTGVYPAGSLMFSGLDGRSVDGGRVWRVTYTFSYSSIGWQHRDRWTGPDGKPPPNAVEEVWNIYQTFDFNTLGLDFSDDQTPIA